MCFFTNWLNKKKIQVQIFERIDNSSDWSKMEIELKDRINEIRRVLGLNELIPDRKIKEVCDQRVFDVSQRLIYSHAWIGTPINALKADGLSHIYEILGKEYYNPESAVKAWVRSELHFKQIINPDNKYFAPSVLQREGEKDHYCVLFAR